MHYFWFSCVPVSQPPKVKERRNVRRLQDKKNKEKKQCGKQGSGMMNIFIA